MLTFQNTVVQCSLQVSHPHHTSKKGEEREHKKISTLQPQSYKKEKASWRGYLRANVLRCHSQGAPIGKERKADTEQLNCQNAQVMAFFFFNQNLYFKFFPPVFSFLFVEAGEVTFWAPLIYYLSQQTSFNNKQKSPRIQKHLHKTCFFDLDSTPMLSLHVALIQETLPSRLEYNMLVFWLIRNLENCTVRMWLNRQSM